MENRLTLHPCTEPSLVMDHLMQGGSELLGLFPEPEASCWLPTVSTPSNCGVGPSEQDLCCTS